MSSQTDTSPLSERYTRNSDLVCQDSINLHPVAIVGVGAIGSQLAEQLAKLGVRSFTLIDMDCVSEVNLPVQGFYEDELGDAKVMAVADRLKRINSQVEVTVHARPWTVPDSASLIPAEAVIFACVDDMAVRRKLVESELIRRRQPVFFDGRVTAESFKVFAAAAELPESVSFYRDSLFANSEMFREACTAKATIYCASIAAGCICAMFKQRTMREKASYFGWHFDFNVRMFDVLRAEFSI
jgi:sulfur carrier protein ThiS adenylyltransferase